MAVGASLLMLHQFGIVQKPSSTKQFMNSELKSWRHLPCSFSLHFVRQEVWSQNVSDMRYEHVSRVWYRHKNFKCRCSAIQNTGDVTPLLRNATLVFTRSCYMLFETPVLQLVPAAGMIAFAIWGLAPSLRYIRSLFHNDNNWKKSKTYYISTSYLQPLLLWTGVTLICRVLDPVTLSSETSGAVKQRVLTFVKSLSTVLTFTYCLSSLIQQTQKFFIETSGADETSKMGFRFAGKAIYSAVWVAAVSLFMELLGFSTKKWLTAGGLGTVLITLAGREILTNFLSSIMIHATRPFIANEWIQTKIEGYDVSGCVERVGWWSPTIIRGDDREAIHIPNHKFTVNVVRNLSQKNHWRIKTHLAISHLDVNKISNIVADMRKVLAKNPQIEQQRLHRRVFLDNVDPENQALLIMVSCFVRTSHFEEYLCVKEAVLLDLLRVVSHHKARLATPIRTIQNFYGDPETINIPFPESIFSHAGPMNQPILLIEPPRTNGDDKIKRRSSSRVNGDETAKSTEVKTTPSEATILSSSDKLPEKLEDVHSTSSIPASSQVQNLPKHSSQKTSVLETVTELADGINLPVNTKSEAEMTPSTTVATKSAFEDNIVLGVAFEGSKRTLPIEGIDPPHTQDETNELAVGRVSSSSSASTKDKRDPVMSSDQRDQGK